MFAAKNEFFTPSQGYQISRSVRLRSSASAYFNRNLSTASTTTWTLSFWFKNGLRVGGAGSGYGSVPGVFEYVETTGAGRQGGITSIDPGATSQLCFYKYAPSVYTMRKIPAMVLRDPSAWYHAVFVWNTTSSVAEDRAQIWINGTRVTAWSVNTNPAQNEAWLWSIFTNNFIGAQNRDNGTVLYPWDGYLTEVNFIDGQALTASSFGQFNSVTGVWQPLKYTGTYGTNGFYLNFSDNSNNTATTIGKDYSGNGNNWTPNNISVTSGTTYDSMLDVPTNWADGGNGRGNYAVMNPLQSGSYVTQSNGNLTNTGNTATNSALVLATIGELTSGKWYWEYTQGTVGSETCGVVTTYTPGTSLLNGENIGAFGVGARASGTVFGGTVGSITSWTTGDVIGLALDCDNGAIYWSKNGTWLNSGVPTSGASKTGAVGTWTPSAAKVTPAFGAYNGGSVSATFGQRPFTYTPPTGFKALNTQNLPSPTISNGALYMAATLWTGDATSSRAINNGTNNNIGTTFKPDLVWTKARSGASNLSHLLVDSVRGATATLSSDQTAAEYTLSTGVTAFNSNGFQIGTWPNVSGSAEVGWQWQAGAGTTSSNTSGSITSTVSVNATAGFSVVTYTGNSTANATVGHGLGVSPNLVIIKARTAGSVENWPVYHSSLSAGQFLFLNTTNAVQSADGTFNSSTPVSSTVFQFGSPSNTRTNSSSYAYVAYCFAAVAGYSAFGSYTGNGSTDGPFVFLGFRARFIMVKRTDTIEGWYIHDTSRSPYNVSAARLLPNSSAAEVSDQAIDFLSNGFKFRTSDGAINASGGTYIYAAFAENPFKYSNAR